MGSCASTGDKPPQKPLQVKPVEGKVRFSYFPVPGKGLPSLLFMELHGIEYDSNSVQQEGWAELKASDLPPFKQLPILQTPDAGTIGQEQAVLRYLELKANAEGADVAEKTRINMGLAFSEEMRAAMAKVQPSLMDVSKDPAACEKFWKDDAPAYLEKLEKFLGEKDAVGAGGKSKADAHLYSTLYQMQLVAPNLLSESPRAKAFYDRVHGTDAAKKIHTGQSSFGPLVNPWLTIEQAKAHAEKAAEGGAKPDGAKEGAPAASKAADEEKPLKFVYFAAKGRGLGIAALLEISGLPYEAELLTFEEWPAVKGSGRAPFGQLPFLETPDAGTVAQTGAIYAYIAEKKGLAGKDVAERTRSRMVMAATEDMIAAAFKGTPSIAKKEVTDEEYDKVWKEAIPASCSALEKLLGGKDTFTEAGTTPGELFLFSMVHQLLAANETFLDATPNLKKFYEKTAALEPVKNLLDGKGKPGDKMAMGVFLKREVAKKEAE